MNVLGWEDLARAESLQQHDDYLALLDQLRDEIGEVPVEGLRPLLASGSATERATALLACAAWRLRPETEFLEEAFQVDHSIVVAAAALCFVTCCAEEEALCRRLLLGPDPWTPAPAVLNAGYHLIQAMGLSADRRFVGLLYEALDHPHFCPGSTVAEALGKLGEHLEEDQLPFHRSISVVQGLGGIIITDDEKYRGGGSNCVHCKFFPCRINRYFAGGIDDCKLWNRVDPESLGEIIDQRDWGDHLEVEHLERRPPEELLAEAQRLLGRGEVLLAIPLLCEIVIDSEFQSALQPVVWIDLARCFSALGEPLLAHIAMREAARTPNLIGLSYRDERDALAGFVADPEAVFGRPFPASRDLRFGFRAGGYKEAHLNTQALDCYAMAAICQLTTTGGRWFEMGECFGGLGETWLAELYLRKGAALARSDIGLRERFLQAAEEVRRQRTPADPTLAVERRRADRARSDPPNLCVVDPVEETVEP